MNAPTSLAADRPRRKTAGQKGKRGRGPTEGDVLCAARKKHDRPVRMDTDSDHSDDRSDGGESSDDEEWTGRSPTYRRRPVKRKPTSSGGSKATSRKGAFKRNAAAALLTLSALATAGGVLPISRPCNEPFKLPSGETVLLATPKVQLDEWWAESQSLVQEMNVLVDGFNKTHGRKEAVLSLPRVETMGDLLDVKRWIVMNYDVWYQHCADLMTNEGNVSAAQALRGFWHMCADSDFITRDAAEAIAAGHKVMDVFCLAQKTGVYQCFDDNHVQSFMPPVVVADARPWTKPDLIYAQARSSSTRASSCGSAAATRAPRSSWTSTTSAASCF